MLYLCASSPTSHKPIATKAALSSRLKTVRPPFILLPFCTPYLPRPKSSRKQTTKTSVPGLYRESKTDSFHHAIVNNALASASHFSMENVETAQTMLCLI